MKKKPERLEDVVRSVLKDIDKQQRPTAVEIDAAWKDAAGEKAFGHTKAASLRKKKLLVNVDGSTWLYALTLKKDELLQRLQENLGKERIGQLQFRIGDLGRGYGEDQGKERPKK